MTERHFFLKLTTRRKIEKNQFMPLYRIHKFVYDTEQSCWKMPQMPQCLCIKYWSFLHTELSYLTMYALCTGPRQDLARRLCPEVDQHSSSCKVKQIIVDLLWIFKTKKTVIASPTQPLINRNRELILDFRYLWPIPC